MTYRGCFISGNEASLQEYHPQCIMNILLKFKITNCILWYYPSFHEMHHYLEEINLCPIRIRSQLKEFSCFSCRFQDIRNSRRCGLWSFPRLHLERSKQIPGK